MDYWFQSRRLDRWELLDLALITVVALAGRLGYWAVKGTLVGKDTKVYTAICDVWLSAPSTLPRPQNAGFTLPFCLFTEGLGLPWDAWIAFQIVLSVASCYLVYAVATRHLDRVAGLVAGVSMAVLWDSFQWNVYILTDALFVVFVTLALWAVSRYEGSPSRRTFVIAWTALLLTVFTRPYGLPIVLGWLAFDLLPRGNRYRFGLVPHPLLGAVLAVLGVAFILSQYPGFITETMVGWWADGKLVHDVPEWNYHYQYVADAGLVVFLTHNLPHMLFVSLLRVLLFFVPVLPRWSAIHNVMNILTLVPMMLASAVAIVDLARRDRRLLRLWAMPLLTILLVVAVTFVDWDWRYRAPAAPVFSLLTGYVAWRLWHGRLAERWELLRSTYATGRYSG